MRYIHRVLGGLCLFSIIGFGGCAKRDANPTSEIQTTQAELSFESALHAVETQWPATQYVDNSLLPRKNTFELTPWKGAKTPLRVGLNWIKNDEVVPLYVGIERGYFADVGLEVEVIPGGPGRRPLPLLASGRIDIYMEAAGSQVIWALRSKTAVPLTVLGAILQEYPYSFITLDRETPRNQRSSKKLQRDDFRGKRIGLSPATPDYLRRFAFDRIGISAEEVQIVPAGATLEPLIAEAYDFYGSWMDNDPRMLDHLGYKNWVYWSFPEHGWRDLATLITVLPQTVEQKPDVLKRFLEALTLATVDMVAHPEEAAQFALKQMDDTNLTADLIMKRIAYQSETIRPVSSDLPVLFVDSKRFDEVAARMYQYGSITLEATD